MTIGHPDFLEAVLPAPPRFIAALGPFAPGGGFGPTNVQVPMGGAYELALFPTTSTEFCLADILVSHLDSRGVPTFQDSFNGVLCGNGLAGNAGNCNAAICRGNIYGTTLQISGTLASNAFLAAVFPPGPFTAAGLDINVYTTPFALDDPQPKVTVAAANIASFTSITPQSTLAVMNGVNVAHSTSTPQLPMLAYTGPVSIDILQQGIAVASNAILVVKSFGVVAGSGPAMSQRQYQGIPNNQYVTINTNLPPALNTYVFTNNDGANAATVYLAVTAGKAA